MKILVINAGSSSIKYQLIDMADNKVLAKGNCQKIGLEGSDLVHKANDKSIQFLVPVANHSEGLRLILNTLLSEEYGVIKSIKEIGGFGHRVVQGGEKYSKPTLITEKVLEDLKDLTDFAPIHAPANIMGIEACIATAPEIPNVAVFDTSFHTTLPEKAYIYPIPYEFFEKYGVKRFGFHGTSHKYISEEGARFIGKDYNDLKIITCHVGNGASISAIKNGKCVDTSMGLTPLEGVMMGTRSGDIDPAIMEFIMNKEGYSIKQMVDCLNKKSGLLGVSGISSDVRDVGAQKDTNPRAKLALEIFCYRIKKYIGAYAAVLGGVDLIVFSAGTGENRDDIRAKIMEDLDYLGVDFDLERNKNFERGVNFKISKESSKVAVVIIPTDEEMAIAKETLNLIK